MQRFVKHPQSFSEMSRQGVLVEVVLLLDDRAVEEVRDVQPAAH